MSEEATNMLDGKQASTVGGADPQIHLTQDSVTTQAELARTVHDKDDQQPPRKRARVDTSDGTAEQEPGIRDARNATAPVKAEYLVVDDKATDDGPSFDDDAAEGRAPSDQTSSKRDKKRQKSRGQNKARTFGNFGDRRGLCSTRTFAPEFSPEDCKHGDSCKFEHDLRTYLSEHKQSDLQTFEGKCLAFTSRGWCPVGYKCRFLGSHLGERDHPESGRKELFLLGSPDARGSDIVVEKTHSVVNDVPLSTKIELQKRKLRTPRSDAFVKWLDENKGDSAENSHIADNRAAYIEGAIRPSEKRKIYYGRDTPALAPLTTQGNLPFRRLCVDLGAQLTFSEMAMSVPLINGHKPEWALIRAHESETRPPRFGASPQNIVYDYDNTKDLKFGAQISGNKPWNVCKATEILAALCPHLRVIDVNCGCPIDLVYDHGAGSALMNYPGKLEKMLMGMNAVSGEIPITCKIRTGTKDKEPTALKLVNRLINGAQTEGTPPVELEGRTSGVAAITLHGRSRQQRYSRSADWEYISECAALIKQFKENSDEITDTIREPDARDKASAGKVFFLGNGDCYSHVEYYDHLDRAGVDSVMVARGALVKPWLFEEIEKNQYLDKSASERLGYVESFVKYGLDTWGTDEMGVSTTRRFLLEWLSFAHRYIPIGILDHLPPSLQDRPPRYRGRNDMETLLASDNYKDWIKISEIYLGPAAEGFRFVPKHKSNSYEYNAEG